MEEGAASAGGTPPGAEGAMLEHAMPPLQRRCSALNESWVLNGLVVFMSLWTFLAYVQSYGDDDAVEMVESWMDTSFTLTRFMLEPLCIVIIVSVALTVGTVCCGRCNTAVYCCCIPKAVRKRFEKRDS